MDWKSCVDQKIAKMVHPDSVMVKTLIDSSNNKLKSEELLESNKITAGSKLSLAYDALREALEALAITSGYKIYNHECYTCFLKEFLDLQEAGDKFDNFRKIRNKVNYYGAELSVAEADKIIKDIKILMADVIKYISN